MEEIFVSEGITQSDRNLLTPSSFAKNNLLYVQEVGKLQSLVPHVCKRNNLDSYLIFEVTKGKGYVIYEKKRIELHKGDCIWIDCHQTFEHISSADEPWQLTWVHFNGKCAKEFYELFNEKNGTIVFNTFDNSLVEKLIYEIQENIKENAPEIKIHGILTQLVVSCLTIKREKNSVKEVREYINVNYKEHGLLETLSERFDIEKLELEKLFKENCGITLRGYIMNRRFNAAKELLRFTVKPIGQVIVESGINDKDLFYQLFGENENMSPEEYREKWAQWIKD